MNPIYLICRCTPKAKYLVVAVEFCPFLNIKNGSASKNLKLRREENMEKYFNRKEIFLENFLHINVKPGQ